MASVHRYDRGGAWDLRWNAWVLRVASPVFVLCLSCGPSNRRSAPVDVNRPAALGSILMDAGERDDAPRDAPVTPPPRTDFSVERHPTPAEVALLRGPRRRASCVQVVGTADLPNGYGGTVQNEECEGLPFRLYRSQYDDDLGGSSQQWVFGSSNAGPWACSSINSPCMALVRAVLTRRSANGSFLEFTCHTIRHRVDRRRAAQADWPCDDVGGPPPAPLYVRVGPRTTPR